MSLPSRGRAPLAAPRLPTAPQVWGGHWSLFTWCWWPAYHCSFQGAWTLFQRLAQSLTPVRPRGPSHRRCGSGPRRAGLASDCDLRGHGLGAASAAAEKYHLALFPPITVLICSQRNLSLRIPFGAFWLQENLASTLNWLKNGPPKIPMP